MHGSRNTRVRLELYFVDIISVEGVAEWTERRRVSAKIRVRLPANAVCFPSGVLESISVKISLYKLFTLLFFNIFMCNRLFIGCAR